MNLLEGKLLAEGQRIGVVAARFNEFITAKLLEEQRMLLYVTVGMKISWIWLGYREHSRFL